MLYLLFVLLAVLFLCSYFLGGKDFFAPGTIQVMTFAYGVLACIYYLHSSLINYSFHFNTFWMILLCMLISVIIGVLTHHMFLRIKVHQFSANEQKVTPIPNTVSILFIIVLLVTIYWSIAEMLRISGTTGTFNEIMTVFHAENSYSVDKEGQLPFLLRQLRHLAIVLFLIYGFNVIRFFKAFLLTDKIINSVIIVLSGFVCLLNGARGMTIQLIIGCVMIFHLLRIQQEGHYKTYKLGFILKIIALFCIVLWAFSALRGFVGRTNVMSPIEYIAYYSGAEIVNLDIYLQSPIYSSDIFGKETFYALIQNLIKLGLNVQPYIRHLELHNINGVSLGNVYTFIRTYYSDFGGLGVFVLHSILSFFFAIFYEYVKKCKNNMGILIFSFLYHCIVLSFFSEYFFSINFSISTFENILLIIFFYLILIQKKIQVKIGIRIKNEDSIAVKKKEKRYGR